MVLTKFTNGSVGNATEINANYSEVFTYEGTNSIRQLIDRAGVWSAGTIDGWGDAYIDSTGRDNSVVIGSTTAVFSTNKYIANAATSDIFHTIPSGTFGETITTAIGVPLITDLDSTSDITFKLTNGSGDDSGFLTVGSEPAIQEFTAFTAQPTFLTVRLSPSGLTSIRGFWVRAE